jgi:hypothetical protein
VRASAAWDAADAGIGLEESMTSVGWCIGAQKRVRVWLGSLLGVIGVMLLWAAPALASGSWTATGSMTAARAFGQTATLLGNGDVL